MLPYLVEKNSITLLAMTKTGKFRSEDRISFPWPSIKPKPISMCFAKIIWPTKTTYNVSTTSFIEKNHTMVHYVVSKLSTSPPNSNTQGWTIPISTLTKIKWCRQHQVSYTWPQCLSPKVTIVTTARSLKNWRTNLQSLMVITHIILYQLTIW